MFFFLLAFNTIGQENLILNGDFEEYWTCPDGMTQVEKCKFVYNPCETTPSTSDYYNNCDFMPYWEQFPRSGDGMVGFGAIDGINNFHYREYVQLEFSETIGCAKTYLITAYFNLSNLYRFSMRNIGFYFSESEIDTNDYLYNLFTPQYTDVSTLIDDTLGWVEIQFQFKAEKEYNYLTIGHFLNDSTDSYVEVNQNTVAQSYDTYFYIDDVSLVEVKSGLPVFPNVFTPNNDGVNDLFGPIDGAGSIEKVFILNRWGNIIQELDYPFEWDGQSKAQNKMGEGVYFYKVSLKRDCKEEKKEQYHGMVHLIR